MTTLQEFMQAAEERRYIAAETLLYGVWVTPRNGIPQYRTVRSSMGIGHVRLEVQRRAIAVFGGGFTFSVRAL